MTQKELRKIARAKLAEMIKEGQILDPALKDACVAILHAPQVKGE